MGSVPAGSSDVETVATPDELMVPVPRGVEPLVNTTEPVVPEARVAVISTGSP